MTFKELAELTRREIDDDTGIMDKDRLVKDYQILAYANEAEVEACLRGRLLVDSSTEEICRISLVPGTVVYDYDQRLLLVLRGKVTGALKPLGRVSFTMLDERLPGWEDLTGDVVSFVTGMDKNKIRLFKSPTVAGTLNLSVARSPLSPMMNEDDSPEIPERLHPSLILWIKHRIYNSQDSELFDKNRADIHLAQFEQKFGRRPAELCDIYDAMQIPQYELGFDLCAADYL